MTAFRADGIEELAREYQDYVIAHRVRRLLGGRLEPKAFLTVPEYAQKRMKRQQIAREIVTLKPFTTERLPDFVRHYEDRTGQRAAICDRELTGDYRYSATDA